MLDVVNVSLAQRDKPQPRPSTLAELAARQHGVVSAAQLCELGLTRAAVGRWAASGRLHRLHRGVYAVGHPSLPEHGPALAAVLACGSGALLSHAAATQLWGLRRSAKARFDVTTTSGRPRQGIQVHRARHLAPQDRAELYGISVTSVPRTLLDLAAVAPPRIVTRAWEEADRLRLLDLTRISATIARTPGHHGLPTILSLIARAEEAPRTRSELERTFLDLCRDHHLPRPELNVIVHGYEVDAYFRDAGLVVELDSFAFHHTRRSFESDRARDIALHLAGLRPIRLTHRRLVDEPGAVVGELRALLSSGRSWKGLVDLSAKD